MTDNHSFTTLDMPMDDNILASSNRLMNWYMQRHSKTFLMRLDIHFPQGMEQDAISTFNRRFIAKEKYAGYDPKYIIARELSKGGRIHYHMALFLNGHKTQNTFEHFKNADQILQKVIGQEYKADGLIDRCDRGHRNGIMIERNATDSTDLHEAQQQISYLAKTDQKANVKGKRYFSSKLNKTSQKDDLK